MYIYIYRYYCRFYQYIMYSYRISLTIEYCGFYSYINNKNENKDVDFWFAVWMMEAATDLMASPHCTLTAARCRWVRAYNNQPPTTLNKNKNKYFPFKQRPASLSLFLLPRRIIAFRHVLEIYLPNIL